MEQINRVLDQDGNEIVAAYKKVRGLVVYRQTDNLLYICGHGPEDQKTGEAFYRGRIGEGGDLTFEEGYEAAKQCAIIHIASLRDYLGDVDKVKKIVSVFGLVNCAEGFDDIEGIMDGFSDTIAEVFQDRGYHARTVMGTRNLPNGNIPVEIEMVVEI